MRAASWLRSEDSDRVEASVGLGETFVGGFAQAERQAKARAGRRVRTA